MKKPDLKLIETPEPKNRKLKRTQVRNFWNTCPKKLDYLPNEECDLGKASAEMKSDAEPPCEWWVNSKEHHYCFWRYIQDVSLPDGRMDPLLQNEIAQLLGCSSTKIHFILKEGLEKLKKSEYLEILADYHGGGDPDSGTGTDVNSMIPADNDSDAD